MHPRSGHEPVLDGLLDAEVGSAGVADGRDADSQRGLEIRGRLEEAVAEWRLDQLHRVDAADDDVGVAVEQAGQQRLAGEVDRLVAVQAASAGSLPEPSTTVAPVNSVLVMRRGYNPSGIGVASVSHPTWRSLHGRSPC